MKDVYNKRLGAELPAEQEQKEEYGIRAKREGYAFVFDKANQSNLLYAEKEFDISDEVLEEMGITK